MGDFVVVATLRTDMFSLAAPYKALRVANNASRLLAEGGFV